MFPMVHLLERLSPLEEILEDLGLIGEDVELEELLERRMRRSPRKTRTVRTTASQRRRWRRMKRLPRAKAKAKRRLRKPIVRKRQKLLKQWRARRKIPKRPVGRGGRIRGSLMANYDRVSTLMEEVEDLVSEVSVMEQDEIIRSYANAALIADQLSEQFLGMAELIFEEIEEAGEASDEDLEIMQDLADLSEHYEDIAVEAADSAEGLFECVQSGVFTEEVNESELTEHFQDLLANILEGVEIYSDLTGEGDMGEDEEPVEEMAGGKEMFGKRGGKGGYGQHPKMDNC